MDRRFNDDLLLSEEDRQLAKALYPEIYHVLDHPELRATFSPYDRIATSARLSSQRIGLLAVALATSALVCSAAFPLVERIPNTPNWITQALLYGEAGGIIGTLITAGGLGLARYKRTWLEARLMTEILRLWHFQSLICRGKEIALSCNPSDAGAQRAFLESRERSFDAFKREWNGSLDSHLMDLIESPEAGYHLLHDKPTEYPPDNPILPTVFAAYKALRFRHQVNYATHKLQLMTSHPFHILKWPAAILQKRTEALASFCLIGSLLLAFLIVAGHSFHMTHHLGWRVGIIVLLIVNVATRAVQDGLAAPEDIQRYNDYAGQARYLEQRFEDSDVAAQKLVLMGELERAALQELKGFLRAHFEARFII